MILPARPLAQRSHGRVLERIGAWTAALLGVSVLAVYFVRAFDARGMRELDPEHRIRFAREFDASQESVTDWTAYLAIEDALARELREELAKEPRPDSLVDRYSDTSLTSPARFPRNWNRSYEIPVAAPRGVAVLLHGLTDSPYSMRATADTLVAAGYAVVVPRMPGHGFAVGGLVEARWEDWTAAVRLAVDHAVSLRTGSEPFVLVGYSNGGLLAIDYALGCDERGLVCPSGIVLLSPAIAITPFASIASWHAAVSWLPYFERFEWFSILPEIDPFKFTSFPKHAGGQIYEIATRTHDRLLRPGEAAKLPPMLTFQSAVDNTVSADAIVGNLYSRLDANGSELVLYDVNRNSTMLHLLAQRRNDVADYFRARAPWPFDVTIVRNRDPSTLELAALTFAAGQREARAVPLELSWPDTFYSLSHVAVPFRADDPVYGDGSAGATSPGGVVIGALTPRGEEGVLQLGSDYFLRTRYNPFFAFQERRILTWLETRLER